MERTLAASSLGAEAERSAQGRLVKAAHGGDPAARAPDQDGAASAPDSREGRPAQRPARPRGQHDQALYDIISGGVLIIHVSMALPPEAFDNLTPILLPGLDSGALLDSWMAELLT